MVDVSGPLSRLKGQVVILSPIKLGGIGLELVKQCFSDCQHMADVVVVPQHVYAEIRLKERHCIRAVGHELVFVAI